MTPKSLMGLLVGAFSVDQPANIPFPFEVEKDDFKDWLKVGEVKVASARALFSLQYSLKMAVRLAIEQHERVCGTPQCTPEDCKKSSNANLHWGNQADVLFNLFGEMVRTEIPGALNIETLAVNQSWEMLERPDDKTNAFEPMPEHPAYQAMIRLTQILRSSPTDASEAAAKKVFPAGNDDDVAIATVTDPRIQQIWLLADELDMVSGLCRIEVMRCLADELEKAVRKQEPVPDTMEVYEKLKTAKEVEAEVLARQAGILRRLAWVLIKDAHIDPSEPSKALAMRHGWKLVALPQDERGGLEMTLVLESLSGPAGLGAALEAMAGDRGPGLRRKLGRMLRLGGD